MIDYLYLIKIKGKGQMLKDDRRKRSPIFATGEIVKRGSDVFVTWSQRRASDDSGQVVHEYPVLARQGIDEKIITPYVRNAPSDCRKNAKFGGTLVPRDDDGVSRTYLMIDWIRFTDPSPKEKVTE